MSFKQQTMKIFKLSLFLLPLFFCQVGESFGMLFLSVRNTGDESILVASANTQVKFINVSGWILIEPGKTKLVVKQDYTSIVGLVFSKRQGYIKYLLDGSPGKNDGLKTFYVKPGKRFKETYAWNGHPAIIDEYVKIETSAAWFYTYGEDTIDYTFRVPSKKSDHVTPFYQNTQNASSSRPISLELDILQNKHISEFKNTKKEQDSVRPETQDSFNILVARSEQEEFGVESTQLYIAAMYFRGNDSILQNYDKALKWYKKAAVQGNKGAQYALGVMGKHKLGKDINPESAYRWFYLSACQGFVPSQMEVGAYFWGLGNQGGNNGLTAYIWYSIAAENGSKKAAQIRDEVKKIALYHKSNVGFIDNFRGVANDAIESRTQFTASLRKAIQGDPESQLKVSRLFEKNKCYEYATTHSERLTKSKMWMSKSVDQEYAPALYILSWNYRYGKGVSENLEKANALRLKSAENGYLAAQSAIAGAYKKDNKPDKALYWYTKAANQEDIRSERPDSRIGSAWSNIGMIFHYYKKRNYVTAYVCYRIAIELGVKMLYTDTDKGVIMINQAVKDIEKLMTERQIVVGERIANQILEEKNAASITIDALEKRVTSQISSAIQKNDSNTPNSASSQKSDGSVVRVENTKPVKHDKMKQKDYSLPNHVYALKVSRSFHHPDCDELKNISFDNRIDFPSREKAIRDGAIPCKKCNS